MWYVKKAFCCQNLCWPFTVWINCSTDHKKIANSWPRISKFFSITRTIFLTVIGQNNFGNKISLLNLLLTNNNFKTHQVEFIFLFEEFSREGTVGPFDVSITNEGKQSHANNKRCITTIEQNMPVSKNIMIKSIKLINFWDCFWSITYA